MIIDYSVLKDYTVEELDLLHNAIALGDMWRQSEVRRLLKQREQMEIDVLEGIAENRWGIEPVSKASQIVKHRQDAAIYASVQNDREIHDPKEILWSSPE